MRMPQPFAYPMLAAADSKGLYSGANPQPRQRLYVIASLVN